MYYFNCFFVYSIFGYFFEMLLTKIIGTTPKSGILYGPITPVYGVGAVIILLVSKWIFKNINTSKLLQTTIIILIVMILLTLIEWIAGEIIERTMNEVFWNYSSLKYNIGKYIALEVTLVWGLMSLILIYIINPFLDNFIKKIPTPLTLLLILFLVLDIIITFIIKKT